MDMLVVVLKSEHARVKLGVNHPVMPPHADQQSEDECYCQPAQYRCEVKDVFQHSSPHGLHQPCTDAAVSSDEQEGAEGYAVKGGHLAIQVVEDIHNKSLRPYAKSNASKPSCFKVAVQSNESASASAENQPSNLPITQHLLLRVVWQGLL